MELPAVVDTLVKRYEHNALLRALVQLIPLSIGSAVDTAVITKVQSIRAERMRVFFDELANGNQELSPELIDNNDFLHCFFATSEVALKTHRAEKIRYFARLLLGATVEGRFSSVDEYEEYLYILDELSYRELSVLLLLDEYETRFPILEGESDCQTFIRFWPEFSEELSTRYSIPDDEKNTFLDRLGRSGCFATFVGVYLGGVYGQGKTTPRLQRIKTLILR
ncbi:hypothetical protein SAMN02745119_00754 [Trichlorobacter thiogenes]|uniref:Uncharacterized protein n=1 Tax=Trichlorobacter thiogenes TaxID=115783 RepID=A0A1T4L3Z9_9BACT|nr:hypothetical protein [Trichlorobacter thiogenes]SJZ49445.1 hypothetical protein SAMN02745119_00754 [Trichlorobacter thiogenes]